MNDAKRYCLVSDDDGHDYLIPADRMKDRRMYMHEVYITKSYPNQPEWVHELGCSTELVTFERPEISGRAI